MIWIVTTICVAVIVCACIVIWEEFRFDIADAWAGLRRRLGL